jgi:GPH family glycoside/pentoside/hexuronide:cation symporter/probable glucitol transport protein GutA
MNRKIVSSDMVKPSEIAGHAVAGVGQNLIFGLWSNFMLVFFTDVFGISGAVAGLIMMFTRVWDAVNDPMMGVIADRTRTRWGRYRPWLMFMALPVLIIFTLNFSAPALGSAAKIVYAAVIYVLMSMVFTAVDVPYWTLPAAMSQDVGTRTTIYTVSRTTTTLTGIVVGIVAIPLVMKIGGGDMAKGYFWVALLIGAAGGGALPLRFRPRARARRTPSAGKVQFPRCRESNRAKQAAAAHSYFHGAGQQRRLRQNEHYDLLCAIQPGTAGYGCAV